MRRLIRFLCLLVTTVNRNSSRGRMGLRTAWNAVANLDTLTAECWRQRESLNRELAAAE
jgi:hypothetical protein